jgi:glycosyltransferase involved in cell wall biosynthesis
MRKAIVYRSNLLPVSETFIKEQMLALRRWRGTLVGLNKLNALSLDGLDVLVLRPDNTTGFTPESVLKRLADEEPSLLHVHFGVEAIHAWPIARALNLPMLITLHGYDISIRPEWWTSGSAGRAMQEYPRRLLELAEQPRTSFIAVSEAIRQRAISFGIPERKITVQYIGVNIENFHPRGRPISERERRVLFVGRLVEKKGCEYLIRAFARVQPRVPDAKIIIVGDGHLRESLTKLAQILDVRADFLGSIPSVGVRRELELARVFCLPSVTALNGDAEGFGIVLLEAQASGVPVITSASGGATEGILEGITGFAFDERDVLALADKLIYVLTNNLAAESMASAAPKFVAERFNIVRCTEALETLWDKVSVRSELAIRSGTDL